MTDPFLEKRVTDLEMKLTYQDDLLGTLNDVIVELRKEIGGLERRVKLLEESGVGKDGEDSAPNEKPPHY